MSAAFTPGPWLVAEDAHPYSPPAKVVALPDGTVIAEALGNDGDWPESEPEVAANARLIAAAPELFTLSELALTHMEQSLALILESHCLLDDELQPRRDTIEDVARDEVEDLESRIADAHALLAKVRGEQVPA